MTLQCHGQPLSDGRCDRCGTDYRASLELLREAGLARDLARLPALVEPRPTPPRWLVEIARAYLTVPSDSPEDVELHTMMRRSGRTAQERQAALAQATAELESEGGLR